ncbi:MAG: hypothetical protein ACRYGP_14500 [Janthinobacterium lividum]
MRGVIVASLLMSCSAAWAEDSTIPYEPNLVGQTVECTAFRHGADGSWTTLKDMPMQRLNEFTTISAGTVIVPGGPKIVGMDVGAVLDTACSH